MRLFRASILVILTFVGISANADFAVAPGTVPVEALFEQSTLVCNCYVSSVEDRTTSIEVRGRLSTRHKVTAQVVVWDVYKSDDPRSTTLMIRYVHDEQQGVRVAGSTLGLSKGETALLFVTRGRSDAFEFADPFIGAIAFSSLPTLEKGTGPPKLQSVLATLVSQSPDDRLAALQVLLRSNTSRSRPSLSSAISPNRLIPTWHSPQSGFSLERKPQTPSINYNTI